LFARRDPRERIPRDFQDAPTDRYAVSMTEGERQLLGAVVICGMLIGALLATWPRGSPAAGTPPSPACSVVDEPAMVLVHNWNLQPGDRSCEDQYAP
jgi:hypothetical protein